MNRKTKEQAVLLYRQLIEAWNRRSAADFAALFSQSCNTIGFDGSPMDGQEAIASTLQSIFANHPTAAYVAKIREVRPLGADVMLLRAVVGMIPPGQTKLNAAVNALQSVVMVEEGGQLRIALLHNTPAAFHGRPHLAEQLTDELADVLRGGQVVQPG